jgi:hypothetical protein
LVRKLDLDGTIEVVDPVPHSRSLQYQLASDVLLLVLCEEQAAAGVMTGKLLEYVGSGRPILALAPAGEAASFVRTHNLGWVVAPNDVAGIASLVDSLVAERKAGRLSVKRTPLPGFSAADTTRQLADVFTDVVGRTPVLARPSGAAGSR